MNVVKERILFDRNEGGKIYRRMDQKVSGLTQKFSLESSLSKMKLAAPGREWHVLFAALPPPSMVVITQGIVPLHHC